MKTALVLGGSGFIGSFLLRELLARPDYGRVVAVFRKAPAWSDPKLEVLVGDQSALPSWRGRFAGDELFVALGTTRKATPDPATYYRLDHDYPIEAARLAKENGARAAFIVTAVGADPRSPAFYPRLKGDVERDLAAVGLARTRIFRPSMLLGERTENRPLERVFLRGWSAVNPWLARTGSRFTGIRGDEVARAMVAAAAAPDPAPLRIYEWSEMMELLRAER